MKLYLLGILLAGSPAFGLEALLLGAGGRLPMLYRKKMELIKVASVVSLAIVGVSTGLDLVLNLEPIYLIAIIFLLTFVAGWPISLLGGGVREEGSIPPREGISRGEIESMLRDRGLDRLIEDEEGDSSDG